MFEDFLKQFNGKPIDYDGVYGAQCFDLIQEWNVNWLHNPFIPGAYAKQIMDADRPGYTRVYNTATNYPTEGCIIVWDGNYNGGPGHTGVSTKNSNQNLMEVFEQNDPTGSVSHVKTYNYNHVTGWLKPNQIQGDTAMTDKDKAVGFDRGITAAYNAKQILSGDSQKANPDTLATVITNLKADRDNQAARATKFDQICNRLGFTGPSSDVTVDQVLAKLGDTTSKGKLIKVLDLLKQAQLAGQ